MKIQISMLDAQSLTRSCSVLKEQVSFNEAKSIQNTATSFGGDGGGEPRVPIPNTTVKPSSADGTWTAGSWESRTSPSGAIALSYMDCLLLKLTLRRGSSQDTCTLKTG